MVTLQSPMGTAFLINKIYMKKEEAWICILTSTMSVVTLTVRILAGMTFECIIHKSLFIYRYGFLII